jgi:hypothetical protein
MNEMAYHAKVAVPLTSGFDNTDFDRVSRQLRRVLHSRRGATYIVPLDEARERARIRSLRSSVLEPID